MAHEYRIKVTQFEDGHEEYQAQHRYSGTLLSPWFSFGKSTEYVGLAKDAVALHKKTFAERQPTAVHYIPA